VRIARAAERLKDWLQSWDVSFNSERDKLQLLKWERSENEYTYHYSLLKGTTASAGKVKAAPPERGLDAAGDPGPPPSWEGPASELSPEL
jgi:hypothetical protein